MCHEVLQDARLYLLLLRFDEDIAREVQQQRCQRCGGRLDQGHFLRKPRVPPGVALPDGYEERFSYSCAVDGCRKRHTPPSTRFFGRRIYLGAVVVLATAMQQGKTRWRSSQLRKLLDVSVQTLARWRAWWAEAFAESPFWKATRATFQDPVATSAAPSSLLERFRGEAHEQLVALLHFLSPLSTTADYVPDRRR